MIRRHGAAFLAHEGQRLSIHQRKTLALLAICRTPALGRRVWECDGCGRRAVIYRSCGDRHCPQCQGAARQRWLAQRTAELLPVGYLHVVFTVPEQLHVLAIGQPRVFYELLLQATRETLLCVAADPRQLGARIGGVMVLHTWGQTLQLHPHVHVIIPGGGLSPDGQRWISTAADYFLPVKVLSQVFRRKLLSLIAAARRAGRITFRGGQSQLASRSGFGCWLADLRRRAWVVYCQPPLGGPAQALKYLARYTYRVAISNSRIVAVDERQVTFQYKDYAAGGCSRTMRLTGGEFLRRFCQHILSRGFVRIRMFGLLCGRGRRRHLAHCRELLAGDATPADARPTPASDTSAALPDSSPAQAAPDAPDAPAGTPVANQAVVMPVVKFPSCPDCDRELRLVEELCRPSVPTLVRRTFRRDPFGVTAYWNSS